jgi:hypothetical protein
LVLKNFLDFKHKSAFIIMKKSAAFPNDDTRCGVQQTEAMLSFPRVLSPLLLGVLRPVLLGDLCPVLLGVLRPLLLGLSCPPQDGAGEQVAQRFPAIGDGK